MSEPSIRGISHQQARMSWQAGPHHNEVAAERKAILMALAAARESEARLRLALDASEMGTFIWRIREDSTEPDRRMLALLGLPADRTFSLAEISTLIHPDDRVRVTDAFARAIEEAGPGALREEFRVLHADGSVRWLAIMGQTAFEDMEVSGLSSGRCAVQMAGVATDITERKCREANLALLDDIADDCARLSSADEILRVVGGRLGAYLNVPSVCLVHVDDVHDELRIVHMWNEPGAPPRPDIVRISDFVTDEFRVTARAGHTLVVHDTETDPRTNAKANATNEVRAFISVPFIRDGAWKFMLTVCDSRPHIWREDEVSLFR